VRESEGQKMYSCYKARLRFGKKERKRKNNFKNKNCISNKNISNFQITLQLSVKVNIVVFHLNKTTNIKFVVQFIFSLTTTITTTTTTTTISTIRTTKQLE
jgi:hypothetical protein